MQKSAKKQDFIHLQHPLILKKTGFYYIRSHTGIHLPNRIDSIVFCNPQNSVTKNLERRFRGARLPANFVDLGWCDRQAGDGGEDEG